MPNFIFNFIAVTNQISLYSIRQEEVISWIQISVLAVVLDFVVVGVVVVSFFLNFTCHLYYICTVV